MEKQTLTETSFQFNENGKSYDVSFHANKGFSSMITSNITSDSTVNKKIQEAFVALMPYENRIIEWISRSADNGQQYVENPMKAMQDANIGIPQDVIQMVKEASDILLTTLKK
ncbi:MULTISPECIES: hypothetical protein [Chryseobacterium]|uniref:Uncharacterized protein n=1 Tax=Chryseobacterium rhizosphaerae TaxID=395937 RepID=A0AAE4C3N4_9FLAO|nr:MULTISPECIES: hypothetical protein [Chryseobacterium]MBL3550496.1 hypothetical protein [Chryseobacterium sp. KMC2]MDR6528751.1 hypothetical protein [Chryseobacterium rhizosphaerae]SMD03300.1 hypothetical protein SAMN02787074_0116 [Chryseobacterium sp. YR221]